MRLLLAGLNRLKSTTVGDKVIQAYLNGLRRPGGAAFIKQVGRFASIPGTRTVAKLFGQAVDDTGDVEMEDSGDDGAEDAREREVERFLEDAVKEEGRLDRLWIARGRSQGSRRCSRSSHTLTKPDVLSDHRSQRQYPRISRHEEQEVRPEQASASRSDDARLPQRHDLQGRRPPRASSPLSPACGAEACRTRQRKQAY